jgi:hypothetical protein
VVVLVCVAALGVAAWTVIPRDEVAGDIDAVVVLGGGSGERVAHGLQVATAHAVPLVLAGDAAAGGAPACGSVVDVVEVRCAWPRTWSTAGEAREVADLAAANGWQRMAVVTSRFHVNRARTLFVQCLGRDAVDVLGVDDQTTLGHELVRHGRELVAHAAAVTLRRAC